jgi:hypothetical protein
MLEFIEECAYVTAFPASLDFGKVNNEQERVLVLENVSSREASVELVKASDLAWCKVEPSRVVVAPRSRRIVHVRAQSLPGEGGVKEGWLELRPQDGTCIGQQHVQVKAHLVVKAQVEIEREEDIANSLKVAHGQVAQWHYRVRLTREGIEQPLTPEQLRVEISPESARQACGWETSKRDGAVRLAMWLHTANLRLESVPVKVTVGVAPSTDSGHALPLSSDDVLPTSDELRVEVMPPFEMTLPDNVELRPGERKEVDLHVRRFCSTPLRLTLHVESPHFSIQCHAESDNVAIESSETTIKLALAAEDDAQVTGQRMLNVMMSAEGEWDTGWWEQSLTLPVRLHAVQSQRPTFNWTRWAAAAVLVGALFWGGVSFLRNRNPQTTAPPVSSPSTPVGTPPVKQPPQPSARSNDRSPSAKVVKMAPVTPKPSTGDFDKLFAEGLHSHRVGSHTQVAQKFKAATEIRKDNAQAYFMIARCLYESNQLEQAAAAIGETLRLRPNSAKAHLWAGIIAQKAGRLADARREYQRALQLDPRDKEAREAAARL